MRHALLLGALGALLAPPLAAQPDIEIESRWEGEPQWLRGGGFSGGAFGGGVLFADDVPFGSTVPTAEIPPIRIDFDPDLTTVTRVVRGDDSYADAGTGVFNGAAYDVSDPETPRRLNVVASEDARQTTPDNLWNPTTASRGGREYLMVMASDYDASGDAYATGNPFRDAQDAYYFVSLQLDGGYDLFESEASLYATPIAIDDLEATRIANGEVSLSWTYDAPASVERLRLYADTATPAAVVAADLDPETSITSYLATDVAGFADYYFRLEALDADDNVVARSNEVRIMPFSAFGTTLIGRLDPVGSGTYADIWGYTDPNTGREYALMADQTVGLHVIDVTDAEPVLSATVPGFAPSGQVADAKDVKVWNQYAYLVHEYAPIMVIDLTDPTDPQVAGAIDVQPGATSGGSHNIEVNGDYLYVVGGRSPGGLRVYDLAADPIDPPRTGEYQPSYFHDIHFNGDWAYASGIYDEGVYVLDATNPANPVFETLFTYPAGYMGTHNACSSEDGDYLYVSDEIGTGPWMRAFDVRDLENVQLTAELIVDDRAVVHNCYVEGDFLFVAHYTEGLQVFDIGESPAVPERVGFYDTFTGPGFGYQGAWSVYPYFESGKVIVSDRTNGLFVVGVDGFTAVDAEPGPADAPEVALALDVFPNPTAGRATLRYATPEVGRFRLALYDVLGRQVGVVAEGESARGEAERTLDARALDLASGVYLVRLETEAGAVTTQVTVVR
jgi:choice-of-anchor B domain-containing protein